VKIEMEVYQWVLVALGVAGFVLQSLVLAMGGIWKLAQMEASILGKTQADQDWIDDSTEAGIAGCKWQRPKLRPAPAKKIAAATVKSSVPPPPTTKKHWWQRLGLKKPTR
jgi:hypothetical protein